MLALLLLSGMAACNLPKNEVRRFKGQAADAVIANVETFATDGVVMEVYVVERGAKIHGEPVFRVTNPGLISLRWMDADSLMIRGTAGRLNLQKSSAVVGGRRVDVHYSD